MRERNLPDAEVKLRFGQNLPRGRLRILKTISKGPAYILRHGATRYGLVVRPDGFTALGPLQRVLADRCGLFVDEIELYEVVATADKRRFELK